MANYKYSSDILADILFRANEETDGSSDFDAAALTYLNRAYRAIWNGGTELLPDINELWWWLRSSTPGTIILQPPITTGTISVANNSASATLSAVQATSLEGWFFKVDGHADVFRISAHTAGTDAVTLDSVYTGTTDTAATYRAFKLIYTLSATMLHTIGPMRTYQDGRRMIFGLSPEQMDRQWPLAQVTGGVPRNFAPLSESTVQFSHWGGTEATDYIRVEYDYYRLPDDLTDSGAEEPLIPLAYRYILADYALGMLFIDKNDDRAEGLLAVARNGIVAMVSENRNRAVMQADEFASIRPRIADHSNRMEPLRTDSGFIIG